MAYRSVHVFKYYIIREITTIAFAYFRNTYDITTQTPRSSRECQFKVV